jgi:transcription elongation GreA/GreB family factor
MELTFRDLNNDPITPNDTVEYRVNGGSWVTLTVTSSTKTFSVTLIYGDNSACTDGGSYADTLDVKVGTVTILNYTAGTS